MRDGIPPPFPTVHYENETVKKLMLAGMLAVPQMASVAWADCLKDDPYYRCFDWYHAPPGEVYFGAENPKGELGFFIHSKGGGTPHRLKIRSPSFVNLSILPAILPGHMMSDVVSILGSLDFVMGESDR